MKGVKIYSQKDIDALLATRKGETKFGEKLNFVEELDQLKESKAKYVLLGIPEDIGVRANHGKPGTAKAWPEALKALSNIQVNRYNNPDNLILLGEVNCDDFMKRAANIDPTDPNYFVKLGDIVKQIDQVVSEVIARIIAQNKVPIIIGGGHNNAYGNIKGAAKALKTPINVLNIDAHTDLRQLEHRHSGNGFSYAIEGQYLFKYSVFGLHRNYTPEYIFEEMDRADISYILHEDLQSDPSKAMRSFEESLSKVKNEKFGLELDCDSICGFPSSAKSPSGFNLDEIRHFLRRTSKEENCCYLHICEAAPNEVSGNQTAKAISYFISDFLN
ncbi:formimidoylglutamase [Christiangramia salexigens]|uniref:Formimidoylglutamase n=1 Tax=Christiangramia salexigens TaxID=1913577 RepID=A0A1L3J884_9FLAO|nr:formimidoylglutamase [Christiangramia salexigens]APG61337.1 formimidoylglutamase [Christiangramia salexigens]